MRQSLLLGAYLAHRESWVGRDELLGVFWPEEDEATARHNLSQLVYHCRRQPWFADLEAERTRLRWRIDSDLQLFRAALGAGAWHDALNLYRGPLLDGAPAGLSLGFEAWLEREREALHGAWRDAVLEVAGACEREGRWADAVSHLRALLAQDVMAEDALQAYLRCAGPAGQREAALRAFEAFRDRLRAELDMSPLEATIVLAQRLRGPESAPSAPAAPGAPAEAPVAPGGSAPDGLPIPEPALDPPAATGAVELHNFPAPLTPFVGREAERERLDKLLVEDGARLITLVGPGGSGKTRLAAEVARHAAVAFKDGAAFVPLAEIADPRLLAPAFLQALELQLPAGQSADSFLVAWLASRSLLLVVDNLEHLLDGAGLVPELLAASPGSAVLVTSREPLDVLGEYVFDVPGLDYPTSERQPIDGFDAVTLFVRSALRAHARFVVSPDDRAGIVRICRSLEGMPLGIELAAAWMRRLRPGEVADALEANLDLLATAHSGVPPRQRSVRATLDHSWALLSDEERAAWIATAVFRGGFDKAAADAVTGASLRTLLALVNKSLLYRDSDGRFQQLVVIRQYGLERLRANPERQAAACKLHADYFADLVAQGEDLAGEGQAEWLALLARDHENLGAALEHLRLESREESGLRMANGLLRYWWLRGHYQEARSVFTAMLRLSADRTALRARALSNAGSVARLCEDLVAARELLQESLDIQRELGDPKALAATIGTLGNLIRLQGEYQESGRLMLECLGLYREAGDEHMVANTLNNLGVLATYRDDPVAAERWYQEAFELATSTGEELVAALALGNLGKAAVDRRDWERARRLYGEAYVVFERLGYQVGLAVTDQSLGDLALGAENATEAWACYQRAAQRFNELGDQRGVGEVLASVVAVALALDDPKWALRCIGASRALHQRLGFVPPVAAQAELESQSQRARESVGAAGWAECLDEGERLTAEGMLALVGVRSG